MTRFTLVVRPDGQALLTTREPLTAELDKALRNVVDGWSAGEYPVVVIGECEVVQVAELDLELDQPGAV